MRKGGWAVGGKREKRGGKGEGKMGKGGRIEISEFSNKHVTTATAVP